MKATILALLLISTISVFAQDEGALESGRVLTEKELANIPKTSNLSVSTELINGDDPSVKSREEMLYTLLIEFDQSELSKCEAVSIEIAVSGNSDNDSYSFLEVSQFDITTSRTGKLVYSGSHVKINPDWKLSPGTYMVNLTMIFKDKLMSETQTQIIVI